MKNLKLLLKIAISVGLISYLIYSQDVDQIKETVLQFNVGYLLVGLSLLLAGTYVSAIRWRAILLASRINLSTKELFQLYMKGYFYNNFLPTQMGGDVYKAVSLGNKIKDKPLG